MCRQIYYHLSTDISQLFLGLWESKSILKISIMSLAPFVSKHLILINGWWRQRQAGWDTLAASDQSYDLPWCNLKVQGSSWSQSEHWQCRRLGRGGQRGRCASPRCNSYHHDGMTSHTYFIGKAQTSKRCRLWACLWRFPSGYQLAFPLVCMTPTLLNIVK